MPALSFSPFSEQLRYTEMGMGKSISLLEDLIEKSGGCAVIDGGFATQLEIHGATINDPLWSALCLIKDPDLIKTVHTEYLEAGADILVTSSYQATIPGFLSKGLSIEEGELLLEKSVRLAVEARDKFWDVIKRVPVHGYNRALVAASIGSYGAYLADGSEYSGCYGPDVNLDKLKDFHRRRLQVLVRSCPDLLAFETIPNKLEAQIVDSQKDLNNDYECDSIWDHFDLAMVDDFSFSLKITDMVILVSDSYLKRYQDPIKPAEEFIDEPTWFNYTTWAVMGLLACVELLEEENVQIPSWICFSSVDGENAPSGESFKECLDIINKSKKVNAVGINCAPPHFIDSLIYKFKELTEKPIVVYPNSGEVWDGRAKRWLPSKCFGDDEFELHATRWRDLGAKLIGGCCRTTPSTIRAISKVLKEIR